MINQNLIVGELDLHVPEIPFELFMEYVDATRATHDNTEKAADEKHFFQRHNKRHPWTRRVIEYGGKAVDRYTEYECFKRLSSVIEALPIERTSRRIIMILQEQQPEYDLRYHHDRDPPYGFRLCLGLNIDEPFVTFARLKPEFYHQVHRLLEKIDDDMVEGPTHTITPIKRNTVFCFNGYTHLHKVCVQNAASRLVLIIHGQMKKEFDIKYIQQICAS